MDKKVTVKYQTRKEYCQCCERKLDNPTTSEVREFHISKGDILSWSNEWKDIVEFEDDLNEIVMEFVYETIRFFATSYSDRLVIESSEFEKVKQFVLQEVVDIEEE